jgi:hypothetical protein
VGDVLEQLDVLKSFTRRLEKLGIQYMLTGSMALSQYAIPRSTVDIDIIVAISDAVLPEFFDEFQVDFYIPVGSARNAVARRSMFNVLHNETLVKVDCILLKPDEFQQNAFSRRQRVNYAGDVDIWIISREDLIISKLMWSKKSGSGRQLDDVASILKNGFDVEYVEYWATELRLQNELYESKRRTEVGSADGHDA